MNRERSSGFAVSLIVLTILVGFFAIHRQFFLRAQVTPIELDLADSFATSLNAETVAIVDVDGPPALIPTDHHGLGHRVVQALGERVDDEASTSPKTISPLTEVPAPAETAGDDTTRKDGSGTNSNAVRDVIEHELSHATREERDIWYDELKSLPAGVVRDLLQVRKQLRTLPRILGGLPDKIASADPATTASPVEIPAERASQKIRFHASSYASSVAAVETAISQLRHNLANSQTIGFKRLRVNLVDAYNHGLSESFAAADPQSGLPLAPDIQGEGCRVTSASLDLKQGSLKKTGRQLDLAIDGEGFFVVRTGQKEFLTRCGTLAIDRNRQLCLDLSDEFAVLQPTITIPIEAKEIQISADGIVSVIRSNGTPATPCGQLQLGRVPCPTRLQPMGKLLLASTEISGNIDVAVPMSAGLGEIHQGFLESSNVEFESENTEIEDLNKLLKSFPAQNARSATASNQPDSPNR